VVPNLQNPRWKARGEFLCGAALSGLRHLSDVRNFLYRTSLLSTVKPRERSTLLKSFTNATKLGSDSSTVKALPRPLLTKSRCESLAKEASCRFHTKLTFSSYNSANSTVDGSAGFTQDQSQVPQDSRQPPAPVDSSSTCHTLPYPLPHTESLISWYVTPCSRQELLHLFQLVVKHFIHYRICCYGCARLIDV
jgi:hypothetical protein